MNLNNYQQKPKNSTIYTPPEVSQFIFNLLKDKLEDKWEPGLIFDPCSGSGSLLAPWKRAGYETWGNDNDIQLKKELINSHLDFLTSEKVRDWVRLLDNQKPSLILCNPPFNGYYPKLGSEVWLDKIIELFGKEVPIVLFAPIGFCLNMTLQSKRLEKFHNGTYPPISSIITLPKNIFPGVIFHSEILIFNISGLQPHYFFQPHQANRTENPNLS